MLIEWWSDLEQKLSGIYNLLDIAPLGLNSNIRELNHLHMILSTNDSRL